MFSCPACATSFVLVTLLRHNSAKRFEGTNLVMFSCRMCAMSFVLVTLLRPDGVNPFMPHLGAFENCDNCSCFHWYERSCVVNTYPECWCHHGHYRRTPAGDCVAKNDCIASK
ncbi:uncharacterized protein LOC142591147 [Dermacentor variabilis]|uniref:uncharacterized protein LOC142591147 n=1 Tax=Dermacentor variabilis TaxID=34621 RepID=UPI003F5AFA4F